MQGTDEVCPQTGSPPRSNLLALCVQANADGIETVTTQMAVIRGSSRRRRSVRTGCMISFSFFRASREQLKARKDATRERMPCQAQLQAPAASIQGDGEPVNISIPTVVF